MFTNTIILASVTEKTVYDVFSDIRITALETTGLFSSIGVAIASILAAFTLLKVGSDIMHGRGAQFWQIIRPFIIIMVIANLSLVLKGLDGALNKITMRIIQEATHDEDQMNAAIARADDVLSYYRWNESDLNKEATMQISLKDARQQVESDYKKNKENLAKAKEQYNKGNRTDVYTQSTQYPGAPAVDNLAQGDYINFSAKTHNADYSTQTSSSTQDSDNLAMDTGGFGMGSNAYDTHSNTLKTDTETIQYNPANEDAINQKFEDDRLTALQQIDDAEKESRKRVKDNIDDVAKKANQKRNILLSTDETPWDGLVNYIGSNVNPSATSPQEVKDNMSSFHGLSTITNWLANKLYLIMNAWAELTLIILAFLAPFIFAFSVLPFYQSGISGFFARYIQISFWKVCAAAVNWASVSVRYAIMTDKIDSLSKMYEGDVSNIARITTYDFVTLFISIATIFAMFSIPKIASYVIESSGTAGAHDSSARAGGNAAKKPLTLAGGGLKKKILG